MSLTAATRAETTKLFSTSIWWILAIVLFAYVAFTAGALAFVFSMSATGSLLGVVGVLASVGVSAAILSGFGLDTQLTSSDIWAMLGRMLLAYVLWALIGIGVGALVRNQVGAIVGVLVFTQFLEPIGRTAAAFVDGLSDATRFLPGAASDALVGASVYSVAAPGAASSDALEWWAGGLVLLGYAVVFVVLGHLVSWRRDVS